MKSKFWTGMGFLAMTALVFSQQAKPVPAFSTADKVAIQTFEKAKQDAQKMYSEAQQGELNVLREFEASHPGFTVNQQTFVVEPVAAPKAEPKKE